MSFFDADDFDEEFVNEDEEANGFEVTMSAVFEGHGDDPEIALVSARAAAEESIYDGEWELDDGKLVGEPDGTGRLQFEFLVVAVIEADTIEEAVDVAAGELSDDWDLSGDPTPVYVDEEF